MSKLESVHQPSDLPNRKKPVRLHGPPSPKLTLGEEAKLVFQDISTIPTKTPVSVLQELLCRRGKTPKYELVQIEGAIHEPIFRYRVFLNSDYMATGTGRSKKDAKHAAAQKLLELLVGKLTLEQANATNGSPIKAEIPAQAVSPFDDKVMGNPIGWLQEMCMSKRWPPPYYEMEHEEGLPHERQFTIACQVLNFREIGTGKSKKLAKRMAAHKMWQALQDMNQDGCNSSLDEENANATSPIQEHFSGIKEIKMKHLTPLHTSKVATFHKNLRQNAGPKLDQLQVTPLNGEDFDYIQYLAEISNENVFDVTYMDIEEKSFSGKFQCLAQLSTLPVAVCYGWGDTIMQSHIMAAKNALEYLKILTRK
ncbi:interferon-inducible double-stranded RNA-dependent protein kinase activator A homolog B-like [Harmonia axyridis]|uniref:interferon-inducible double-stranded RNA-dependent protein kinase activator A homolog B-like n=1 Tax=Harmonia axyridis TaxID=115357 RepID=UPI001E277F59|nr:interferon-inducible double-stranded RNA-dependent protein kinase activator A homolog B-like [Harmonia axyridis]